MSTPEVVTDITSALGEGPLWYRNTLLWVDILGKKVHTYMPTENTLHTIELPHLVGAVVPRKSGGLVAALETGFAHLDPGSGEITPIYHPEPGQGTRFNDGKCDPQGRFWAGTMSLHGKPNSGSLYMLDTNGNVRRMLSEVSISNGICWSPDGSTLYYIDTPTQRVDAFDFDGETGTISGRRTVVTIDRAEGNPDGMTIDTDGNLWIALWNGSAVVCHNPRSGRRLAKVEVPARHVTSCTFGGEMLSDLYITTARADMSDEELARFPLSGRLFRVRPGATGLPAAPYAG